MKYSGLRDQQASWRDRFQDHLEDLDDLERADAVSGLRVLLDRYFAGTGGGVSAGHDVTIHAERGSIAAGVVHGDVSIANPQVPDPDQG